VQDNFATQSEEASPTQPRLTAVEHQLAREEAPAAACGEGSAARDDKDLGPKEDGEQFSPYSTLLCDQIEDSCCT
jgi:hypothetical protein